MRDDLVQLSKTMSFLLRHRPDVGRLEPDEDGWVEVTSLCVALERVLHREVGKPEVERVLERSRVRRFEISGRRIRAVSRMRPPRGATRVRHPPDILYHATTVDRVAAVREDGALSVGAGRHVYLSSSESQAWRVAHRQEGEPEVLYVDTTRARRAGARFYRNRRSGLFLSTPVPVSAVLNLAEGFDLQLSAGGIPVRFDDRGRPWLALIKVTRRSGVTWEVAKGKLEPGEPPEHTALREVREEMGTETPMRITRYLDTIRYGFLTPGGEPRLKSVFLYLMEARDPDRPVEFDPLSEEGIRDVRWFPLDEACQVVTHSSLRPVMRRVRRVLEGGPGYAE